MRQDIPSDFCGNEGCGRATAPDERFCEACSLEWTLFRRDTRPQVPPAGPSRSPDTVNGPARDPAVRASAGSVRLR
jgi:hypothetical protein